jgi:hypothetical protein
MKPASYRDIQAEEIPMVALAGGGTVKVVAGQVTLAGRTVAGPIGRITTQPLFLDVSLPEGGVFSHALPSGHNAFVYAYAGKVAIGEASLSMHQAGILSPGDQVTLRAVGGPAQFLLLAAQPLHEPVVQYGPFVMNSREQIEQAIDDYHNGKLV